MAADKHKIWLISSIVIVILIIGFIFLYPNLKKGLAGQAIGAPVSLTLAQGEIGIDPVSGTIKTGESSSVFIKTNLGTLQADSVEVTIKYDSTKVESVTAISLLPTIFGWPANTFVIESKTPGTLILKHSKGTSGKKLSGKLVSLFRVNFKVKSTATGNIIWKLENAKVLDNQKNLINSVKSSFFTVQSSGCTLSCAGKTCGSDGCGGSCGTCAAMTKCQDNICKDKNAFLCTETDNGKDLITKGTLYSFDFPNGIDDECTAEGKLSERYCGNNIIQTYEVSCLSGFKCDDGSCIPSGDSSIISLSSCATPTEGWQSGTTYKLSTDITTTDNKCFSITGVKDIVFDCDGHKIIGGSTDPKSNTLAAGIYFNKVNSSVIKNCKISIFPRGIYMLNSKNNQLLDNTLSGTKYGIYLYSSTNTIMNNNNVCGNSVKDINCGYSNSLSGTGNKADATKVSFPSTCSSMTMKYTACDPSCTPSCAGKTCGDDGCGGSCGSCSAGTTCSGSSCLTSCSSNSDCPITCDGTKGVRKTCEYGVCGGLTETWLATECAEKVECMVNTDCGAGEKCENSACVAQAGAGICSKGDLNGDKSITSDDVTAMLYVLDAQSKTICGGSGQTVCDYSGDGYYVCKNGIIFAMTNENDFAHKNDQCGEDSCAPIGDLNGDKSITSDDVTAMLYVLDAQSKTTCGGSGQTVCDYSGDGYYVCKNGVIFAMTSESDTAHAQDKC